MAKHLTERLAELRDINDSVTLTNDKTLVIRGRIAELKELLALPQRGASEEGRPDASWPVPSAE